MTTRTASRVAAALLVVMSLAGWAADRQWQSGAWRESSDGHTYVIVAGTVRLQLEDVPATGTRAHEARTGTPVKFAVEADRVFVLDPKGVEYELHLLQRVDLNYTAIGAGHFVKAISSSGLTLTLEDNSVWELDARSQFFTVEWQAFDGIAVRRTDPERDFNYEIDNIDKDNGALARYSPP